MSTIQTQNKEISHNGSYSGTDIEVFAVVNNSFSTPVSKIGKSISKFPYKKLGELQTISYSIYRDKNAVKRLGHDTPHGYSRGFTTVAGTMIFTVIYGRILNELFSYVVSESDKNLALDIESLRVDELPPIDLFIFFDNEYGQKSRMSIFGVEFMNEGQVMSVSDLITENSVNYLARYISPMRRVDSVNFDNLSPEEERQLIYNDGVNTEHYYDIAKKEIKKMRERWL